MEVVALSVDALHHHQSCLADHSRSSLCVRLCILAWVMVLVVVLVVKVIVAFRVDRLQASIILPR